VIKPEKFMLWNKKIKGMSVTGQFTVNQFFATVYNWHGRQSQCKSIATRIIDGEMLELRHSDFLGKNMPHELVVLERITLQENKEVTVVTKDVFMKNHGLPFFLVPVFWFVNRFGWSPEPDHLQLLCEREGSQ
jgi:hypothetical protein